jgi:putative hydrolase of HD superfamily
MNHSDLRSTAAYLYEVGQLKHSRRSGWWLAGVSDPESIAEHSFRTAIVGYLLAQLEGVDQDRTALLCLFHDVPEARTGDIPTLAKHYITASSDVEVAKDQLAGLQTEAAGPLLDVFEEYFSRTSKEAIVAHDADKIECLIQAREYQLQGFHDVRAWIDSSLRGLKTESAKRLGAACLETDPGTWWKNAERLREQTEGK